MKLTLNLASRTYLNRRALVTFYWLVIAALVALLCFNLVFFLRSQTQARQIKAHLQELERDLAKGQGEVQAFNQRDYETMLTQIEAVNGIIVKDSFRWSALLGHLETLVPEGVALRSIQPDFKTGVLELQGVAEDVPKLRRLLDQLVADERLGDVNLLQQAHVQEKRATGTESSLVAFSIVIQGGI